MTCATSDCIAPVKARGLCQRCYRRNWEHARKGVPPNLEERFWSKVDVGHPLGCWQWTGAKDTSGYGHVTRSRKRKRSHRVAYEYLLGPIPAGLQIDHLCKNKVCVNPDHLEPVTHQENLRRGESPPMKNARRTECRRGHRYEDVYVDRDGARHCRECRRVRRAEARVMERAA